MIATLKPRVSAFVCKHPFIWRAAWEVAHHFPPLLPHDPSYRAFRHMTHQREGLFLDIGANDGISALSFRRFSRDYEILALEPNRALVPRLEKLKRKDSRFRYLELAAGRERSSLEFHIPHYRGLALHPFTSTDPLQIVRAIEEAFGPRVAAQIELVTIESEIIPVDDLGVKPTIVKIDAEGSDFDVLLGARRTLAACRPFIVVEAAWADLPQITALLREERYLPLTYDHVHDVFSTSLSELDSSRFGQRNLFALPEESLQLPALKDRVHHA